jgi:3D (Asp-Asp-Asp) domain-containing protein
MLEIVLNSRLFDGIDGQVPEREAERPPYHGGSQMHVSRLLLISALGMFLIGMTWPSYRVMSHERAIQEMVLEIKTWREAARRNMEELEQVVSTKPQGYVPVRELEVTAYTPTVRECNAEPLIAASMRKVRLGTVAVSRDLFEQGWVFGKKVYIQGHGIYEINDLMNRRLENSMDVFMWEEKQAREFGRRQLKVALLDI